MSIRIERSGGFAGIREDLGSIDTDQLGTDEAATIRGIIERLRASMEAGDRETPVGADLLRYDVEIREKDGVHRHLIVIDDGNPEDDSLNILHELLAVLGIPM